MSEKDTAGKDWLEELRKMQEQQPPKNEQWHGWPHYYGGGCPSCGYCSHCGRGGHHSRPHFIG